MAELQQQGLRPSAPQHYEYIFNRVVVEFKPKNEEDTTLQTYTLELSRKNSYDQVKNGDHFSPHLLQGNLTDPLTIFMLI